MNGQHQSKRRYSELENEVQHDKVFALQNLATSNSIAFEPLTRLLRAHLPLSWLAPTSSHPSLSPASILQGKITYLSCWEYSVLIARQAPNGGLIALEKFDDDCFVVHPLQPFVTDQWVRDASIGAAPLVSMQTLLHYIQEPDTTIKEDFKPMPNLIAQVPEKMPKNRRGAAARVAILHSHETRCDSPSQDLPLVDEDNPKEGNSCETQLKEQRSLKQSANITNDGLNNDPGSTIQAEDETCDYLSPAYLRQRYLEHLYKSKTSLGYYTKGPLSRARARARAPDSSMPLFQLASFYRDSVLPAKKMDLKYKDSLKEVIKTTTVDTGFGPNAKTKAKSSRKTKLDKNGLWPSECGYISEWWRLRTFTPNSTPEKQDAELRDALASLRIREAQMQIILILEALSIEAKAGGHDHRKAMEDPQAKDDVNKDEIEPLQPEAKTKHRNLEAELEVLADKLCIWHSVGLENAMIMADVSGTTPQHAANTESSDRLRTFCTDIIMTFYNSKLPLICQSLCKTLAGHEVYEHFQKSSLITQRASHPKNAGNPVERRAPSGSARSLERVLSESGRRHSSPPPLLRSSTLPPITQLKREPSDLNQRPQSRSSRQNSVSFTKREVDLTADAHAITSKRRKLELVAYVKREAAAAIQALKKPNRAGAGKAYMDEVDKRKTSDKKQAIQITATPRTNRTTFLPQEAVQLPRLPPGNSSIPSSTTKLKGLNNVWLAPRASATKRAVLAAIQNTPSKSVERQTDSTDAIGSIFESPRKTSQGMPELVFATPQKVKKTSSETSDAPENGMDFMLSDSKSIFKVTDVAFKTMQRAMGEVTTADEASGSIYDTLGWNDNYDI